MKASTTMNATSDETSADPSAKCEQARQCAEGGDLDQAARLFQEVLDLGETAYQARAALGLAVILEDQGDVAGARRADRIAVAAKDPEYAPRAAYHLALSHERAAERQEARDAWQAVVEFGNDSYLPPAFLALAQLADEDGDLEAAQSWWARAIATGDEQYAPAAAHDLASRLLEQGEPAAAQRILAEALERVDRPTAPYAFARLTVSLGIAHLEQAIDAFRSVLEGDADTDPQAVPLAVELLARALPLRGRAEEAGAAWRRGLDDPRIAEAVRARIRREFGAEDEDEDEDLWWERFVESAVCSNTLPQLTGELFGAIDHMYALIAMHYAEGAEGLPAEADDLLGRAVRVPGDYVWGRTLHDSFAERLRQAMRPSASVAPAHWRGGRE